MTNQIYFPGPEPERLDLKPQTLSTVLMWTKAGIISRLQQEETSCEEKELRLREETEGETGEEGQGTEEEGM